MSPPAVGPDASVTLLAVADLGQAEVDGSMEASEMIPSLDTTARLAAEADAGAQLVIHNGDISCEGAAPAASSERASSICSAPVTSQHLSPRVCVLAAQLPGPGPARGSHPGCSAPLASRLLCPAPSGRRPRLCLHLASLL